jgi:hypothetical protein
MMRDSIVWGGHLEAMFTTLKSVDDGDILEILHRFEYFDDEAKSVLSAFRALVSEVPIWPADGATPVHALGIVGAASVPTAMWPYLILAELMGIPVKVKVPAGDIHSLMTLEEIMRHAFRSSFQRSEACWQITSAGGDALLSTGFWDDCDRLLVFGSDATVALYRNHYPEAGRVIGFGHLESLLLVDLEHVGTDFRWMVDLLAFGHTGCLAPRIVVPLDQSSASDLAEAMLGKLTGLVHPDIERAVALRHTFHAFVVAGHRAWLSDDGMWLVSEDDSVSSSLTPGHLRIVMPAVVNASQCKIGTLSNPNLLASRSPDIEILKANASWNCSWGMAQFPSINWCNAGIPIISTLCR